MSGARGGGAAATAPAHGMPPRVVVTGSESTGKTTLARRVADYFGGVLVPEYARGYAARVKRPLTFEDHLPIARGQIANEDEAIAIASSMAGTGDRRALVVQDTDLLSTLVYCKLYYDQRPPWLVRTVHDRRPDLYLLLETDVPWVPDGIRDMEHRREEVQQLFRDSVAGSPAPYIAVRGDWDARFRVAISAIGALLSQAP